MKQNSDNATILRTTLPANFQPLAIVQWMAIACVPGRSVAETRRLV